MIDSPLSSSRDTAAESDSGLLIARVGLVVVAAVSGVVLTSLAWLVVIYWLRRRHDINADTTSSTSTDETIVPASAAAAVDVSTLNSLQHCVRLLPGMIHVHPTRKPAQSCGHACIPTHRAHLITACL